MTIMKKKRTFAAPPISSSCTSILLAKMLHSNGSTITALEAMSNRVSTCLRQERVWNTRSTQSKEDSTRQPFGSSHPVAHCYTYYAIRVPCHCFGIQVGFNWMAMPSTIPPSRNATCVNVAIHATSVIHPCKKDQNAGENSPRGAYKALHRYLSFELSVQSIKVGGVAKLTVLPQTDSCLPFRPDWRQQRWSLSRTTTCPRRGK